MNKYSKNIYCCDYCNTEVRLSDEELESLKYTCPNCKMSNILNIASIINNSNSEEFSDSELEHKCINCEADVIINEEEYNNSIFECPNCNTINNIRTNSIEQEENYIHTIYCNNCNKEIDIPENEITKSQLNCPHCGIIINLNPYLNGNTENNNIITSENDEQYHEGNSASGNIKKELYSKVISIEYFKEQINKYKYLYDEGILSQSEFDKMKMKIIETININRIKDEHADFLIGLVPLLREGALNENDVSQIKSKLI